MSILRSNNADFQITIDWLRKDGYIEPGGNFSSQPIIITKPTHRSGFFSIGYDCNDPDGRFHNLIAHWRNKSNTWNHKKIYPNELNRFRTYEKKML